jgi:haloalkane dehalogenase
MRLLRTPEDRFAGLVGFDYEPRYVELADQVRMAYVETGPPDGEPVLLLHGEPTWSYLYRSLLPVLAAAGLRAIAPDLIGFGRSDKPADRTDHTYARQVEWVREFALDRLDLHGVTLVGHDWGGLIGLRLATENADRFARIVATNTGLPTGDQPMPDVWLRFRDTVRRAAELDVARLVRSGCATPLPDEALLAYDAPFPDASYKAAPRVMPDILPTEPDDPAAAANRTAWDRLTRWPKPFLVAFSDRDPITGAMGPVLARTVPGATSVTIPGGGHFLQEDCGPRLAAEIVTFIAANPAPVM